MSPRKPERLWNHTYDYLRGQIAQMSTGHNRLEPEEELTRRLGVSRATVREATQALVQEGYVTRRHGKGNLAHPSVASLGYRMDLTSDFIRLLDTGEGAVLCRNLRSAFGHCRESMRQRFPAPCSAVYEQDWLYQTGERPMIFCRVSCRRRCSCVLPGRQGRTSPSSPGYRPTVGGISPITPPIWAAGATRMQPGPWPFPPGRSC